MNGSSSRRRNFAIFGAVAAVSLVLTLTNIPGGGGLAYTERASMTLLAPFQRAIAWGVQGGHTIWKNYLALVDLKKENEYLRVTADRLAFENNALVERLKQIKRVEELLASPQGVAYTTVVARVIGRDTSNRVQIAILDRGTADGVEEGMPVITHRGLVGRIVRASTTVSKLLLITDVRSAVDAVTQESRDRLTVAGVNEERLDVRYLSVDADAHEGDRVVSSGMGGIFPAGLLIGTLVGVADQADSLFKEATVVPAVDFDRLEEALVLKVPRRPAPVLEDAPTDGERMESLP
ncbi:MAG: rod shape-determining protein MreC [Nitrospinae bacterium]|nr:rod shape-determining protein MreC [Nitrospinota bacterium]